MKVRHNQEDFQEGQEMTLVLDDKPILDDKGNINQDLDELVNVRMADIERAKHHEEIRKQVEYDPTKQNQDILSKYDELKTGPKGFILGGSTIGAIDEQDPEKRLAILTALSEKQSLDSKTKFQSDYYTSEEMASFKKTTTKKKTKKRKQVGDPNDEDDKIVDPKKAAAEYQRPPDAGSDEEDPELYEQLKKQRRVVKKAETGQAKKGEAALKAVSERIEQLAQEEGEDPDEKIKDKLGLKGKETDQNVALTATTEFCNVVQTPLEKMETLKHESFRGSTLYKQQVTQRKGVAAGERKARKGQAGITEEEAKAADITDEVVEDLKEDSLDLSCASGLAYLRARQQIGCDQDSHKNRKSDNRPLEMSTVDGDIKLEYRDDFGRVQTPKEAFRSISWKFHGKLPGRKNMERRLMRLENEMRLKSLNVLDNLPTLRALKHVQRSDAKPYMVLSGAGEK